ncbi:hypothetical protein [Brachybacterium sp. GCM10030252]|uniref:hypothetical protein n=1 Tax=Brachybacterium sp. GCM10030252 TaxID=3273380 RepID=UPI0036065C88
MGWRDYRLGFIGASRRHRFAEPSTVSGWNRVLAPGFKFFIHPEAPLHRIEDAEGRVLLVIGDVLVAHGRHQLDELLIRVAAGEREPLDDLSGRFALAVLDGDEGRIMHDPLGSQALFRTLGPEPVVSSHSSLIAACDGLAVSPRLTRYMATDEYRARTTRFLPGDLSLYEEIVHLVPNNELDLRTGRTHRYWPRESIPPSSFEDLVEVWDGYFQAYAGFLQRHYRPVIGLTGGLDSRAVIATLHSMGVDAHYITWDKMPEDEAVRIPRLAGHLGGRHSWVCMDERPTGTEIDEIRQAARSATGLTRGTPLLPAQIAQVVSSRDLFVKGLGGEVMRGPFNSRVKAHLPSDDHESLAYALYAGKIRLTAGAEYAKTTRAAIRGYLERANYGADLHGADAGDLIYWEQRMGTWTAIQHAEFSVVVNSHSAMNSRKLFSTAWGLPDEERFGPALLHRLIERYDSELAAL